MGSTMIRVLVALGVLGALPIAARAEGRVVVLELDSTIQPGSLRYLQRGLREAGELQADAVLVVLDTPGGLLVSLRAMTTAIVEAGPPVVVFVAPAGARAASAGFFLLMASDVAAMAPGTNTGAAHPVTVGAEREEADPALKKAAEDAAALIRSLAAQRGRSVTWAERAVTESRSYTEKEALEKGLIDVVATDRADLIAQLGGRVVERFDGRTETLRWTEPEIVEIRPTAAERVLMAIADPNVAYLLLVIGALGLLVELMSPGLIAPGVVGALSMLLGLYAFSVLPVSYVGALLLLLAVGLFVAEALVTSYGLLTLAGVVAFVLGSLLLVDTPIPAWRVGLWLVLPTAIVLGAVVGFLVARVARSRGRRAVTGAEGLVGEVGEVVVPLDPEGKVFVHGEYWNAVAPGPLPGGTKVRVVRLVGDRLEVRAAEEAPSS